MSNIGNQSFFRRLQFAVLGLSHALRAEHSIRIQLVALAGILLILAVYRPEVEWWALAGLASALVISTELLNTAIEHLADHLHPQIHPSIRVVKDCAAGAVLIASLGAIGVGVALVIHLVH